MFGLLNCAPTLCIIQIKPKYLFEAVESLDRARLKAMLLFKKESGNQNRSHIYNRTLYFQSGGWLGKFGVNRE